MDKVKDGDLATKQQMALLEKLRGIAYFKSFEPRDYSYFEDRYEYPFEYLDQIGIEKVCELIQHGYSRLEISRMLAISSYVFNRWISSDPEYYREVQLARAFTADEDVKRAERALLDIDDEASDAAVKRQVELSKHHRWCASRHDKDTYGSEKKEDKSINNGQQVSYVFNFSGAPPKEKNIIDVEAIRLPKSTIDVNELLVGMDG